MESNQIKGNQTISFTLFCPAPLPSLSLFFLFLSPLFSVLSFPVSGARCELWVKRRWIILRRFNCLTPNYIPHFLKPLSLVRMTAQTFSFRADSGGLRQILRLSRSVTQSVWPRFYLKSLWEGEKKSPFYTLSVTGVSSQSVVLLLFLLHCWMFWSLGEKQKTCPSTSVWVFQIEMLQSQISPPSPPTSPGPPHPPPSLITL